MIEPSPADPSRAVPSRIVSSSAVFFSAVFSSAVSPRAEPSSSAVGPSAFGVGNSHVPLSGTDGCLTENADEHPVRPPSTECIGDDTSDSDPTDSGSPLFAAPPASDRDPSHSEPPTALQVPTSQPLLSPLNPELPPRDGDPGVAGAARDRVVRELTHDGGASLGVAELCAAIWGTGERALASGAALEKFLRGEGRNLSQLTWEEVTSIPGVGRAHAARIFAALELGRRSATRPWRPGERFRGARQVFEHFGPQLREKRREHFVAVLLDVRRRLILSATVSIGSLVASLVHPREVFRRAIQHSAAGVLVLHNHPSGDPRPSPEDWAVTDRLRAAGEILGIELVDHVIIGDQCWVSLRERSPSRWADSTDPGPLCGEQSTSKLSSETRGVGERGRFGANSEFS